MSENQALIPIENLNPIEVFKPEKVSEIIDRIKKQAETFAADPTTEAGRKEISSFCYKIRRSKTALDDMGKNLVSDWKQKSKAVDQERRKIRDELDSLVHEIYRPVEEFKQREVERLRAHDENLEKLASYSNYAAIENTTETIQTAIDQTNSFYDFQNWQEFESKALEQKNKNIESLNDALERRKKYDAEQAELKRLREAEESRKKEEEEKQRKAEQERIAAEAAEKAKREAEERAERERKAAEEKANAERQKIESEKKAAEDRAKQLEKEKAAAAKMAKIEAENAAKRERERIEKEAAEKEAEEQRRAEDKKHAESIEATIRGAMQACIVTANNENTPAADSVISAIKSGKIPHLKIIY